MKGESDGDSNAARCAAVTSKPCGAMDWFICRASACACVMVVVYVLIRWVLRQRAAGAVRRRETPHRREGHCRRHRRAQNLRYETLANVGVVVVVVVVVVVHLLRRALSFPGSARARWSLWGGVLCLSSDV